MQRAGAIAGRVLRRTLAVAGLLAIAAVALEWPSDRVVARWPQPPGVHYDLFDPYALAVVRSGTDLHTIPFAPTYTVVVGRTRDFEWRHHRVAFPYVGWDDDPDAIVRGSTVAWARDGVTLTARSGHRLFIPKAMFAGGR